ncbi:MAG: phenylacetate--CoA ligase family protein [Nitrospinae bacterium]|nr:phenylacetate--CoA ligase family protein [Nitrospinota bacterium]
MILNALLQLNSLRKNQWLSFEALQRIQLERLKSVVRHVYNNMPYYRKLFDSVGVRPEDIKTLADIKKIPITNKKTLKTQPLEDIVARGVNIERCVKRRTSGSTGIPFYIYHTWENKLYQTLMNMRILLGNGVKIRDRFAHITDTRHIPGYDYWFQRFGILRKYFIYAAEPASKQLEELKRIKPDVIYGYSSSIRLLAGEIKKRGVREINPRLIFCAAELLEPGDRELINSAFGVKLIDVYGAVEVGDIAWECDAHEGYHLNIDNMVIEFLKDGKDVSPGEEGKVVCTSLHSYTMPFIRYELGDVCIPLDKMCSCGRGLPLMKMVIGRVDDFIVMPDGKRVSPLVFIIPSIPGIAQYRIIQKRIDNLLVQIVPNNEFSEKTIVKLKEHIKWVTEEISGKNNMSIDTVRVTEIPKDPSSGKLRRVISEIKPL